MRKSRIIFFMLSMLFVGIVVLTNQSYYTISAKVLNSEENVTSVDNIHISNTVTAPTLETSQRYKVKEDAVKPTSIEQLGTSITISDYTLQSCLIKIYRDYNPDISISSVYSDMFQDFTMLDLSGLTYGTSNIVDLTGISGLRLFSLEELNLSSNNMTSFGVSYFPAVSSTTNENDETTFVVSDGSPVKTIKKLDISNNNLKDTLDVSYFEKLTSLNVAHNEYTSIKFFSNQNEECTLDYSFNKITNYDDLTLPKGVVNLNLVGNLTQKTDANIPSNVKLEIGILNLSERFSSDTLLRYIAFNSLNYEVKFYSLDPLDADADYEPYDFNPNSYSNFMFTLTSGYYRVDIIDKSNDDQVVQSVETTVTPAMATFKFNIKGRWYDTYSKKITNKAYIYFNLILDENGDPVKDDKGNYKFNENVKVYYRHNAADNWTLGNVCDLTKRNGTYGLSFKTSENGIESDAYIILVQVSYSKILPDFGIIIIIILVLIFLALVIVPLIKRVLDRTSR